MIASSDKAQLPEMNSDREARYIGRENVQRSAMLCLHQEQPSHFHMTSYVMKSNRSLIDLLLIAHLNYMY